MTALQKEYYTAAMNRKLREVVCGIPVQEEETPQELGKRVKTHTNYEEISDDEYFKAHDLQNEKDQQSKSNPTPSSTIVMATQTVSGSHNLQNLLMQLRKVCNHPYLFSYPMDMETGEMKVTDEIQKVSGKMVLLDQLLTELFKRGHKVLIFSQMTKMLDILEKWSFELKGWKTCRIDGGVSQDVRHEQINRFNTDPTECLFLLSTRGNVFFTFSWWIGYQFSIC